MRCLLFITFCLLGFESPAQSDADYIKTIYKNALTQAEVLQNYTAQKTRHGHAI